MELSSHIKSGGGVRMVDVSAKQITRRKAIAGGRVRLGHTAFDALVRGSVGKGDVLTTAQVAGIQAAKETGRLIPLCHPVPLDAVDLEFGFDEKELTVEVRATVATAGRTGVEMEALTAVAIAALTIYDMCKSVSKAVQITDIGLLRKEGGKSGLFVRSDS
ncbi:MAG: cyclic pyranopterin monophosphate synthase MoaC [Bacteroidota bacterium]|nr:cyclic pyranopterin monophosphate synthase MoaC [Bacteroidota bacterium]